MVRSSLRCVICLFGLADQIVTGASIESGQNKKTNKKGFLFSCSVRIKNKICTQESSTTPVQAVWSLRSGRLHPGPLKRNPFHLSNYQLSFKFILVREPTQPAHLKKSCLKLHSCQHLGHEITLQWKLCKLMQSSFM